MLSSVVLRCTRARWPSVGLSAVCSSLCLTQLSVCLSDMTQKATAGDIFALERLKAAGVNQLSKGT